MWSAQRVGGAQLASVGAPVSHGSNHDALHKSRANAILHMKHAKQEQKASKRVLPRVAWRSLALRVLRHADEWRRLASGL